MAPSCFRIVEVRLCSLVYKESRQYFFYMNRAAIQTLDQITFLGDWVLFYASQSWYNIVVFLPLTFF